MPSEFIMSRPEPLVSCILLSMGVERDAMRARALRSYESQTYANKELIVYEGPRTKTIGELRNIAIAQSHGSILATWDEDDFSHANRVAEQVSLLETSGADVIGFNECLFWDTRPEERDAATIGCPRNEAWLYRYDNQHYALGTSLCYWRRTWEAHPFDAISHGEDHRFLSKCKAVQGVSSLAPHPSYQGMPITGHHPRMICSIHGGNSSPFDPAKSPAMCTRVPQWDSYCAERMALEVRA